MKCPKCSRDQKIKYGLKCGGCGYNFTFNPKDYQTRGFTDGKFVAAIARAGQNGSAVFTENQLYAAYGAKAKSPRLGRLFFAFVLGVIGLMVLFVHKFGGFLLLVFAAITFARALTAKASVLQREQFLSCTKRWLAEGKEIPGLLQEPGLHTPPQDWSEQDIYDYGVERILIVQRDLLVDLLVRNNQHAEQRMLVISETGYPNYLVPHVNRLLDERGDLPVFLLHDADAAGTGLSRRVSSLSWLRLGKHSVVDMGFFPEDFEKLKRTANFENQRSDRSLPADALMMGSLATGLSACFLTQSTFADEILREHKNQMNSGSNFG